MFFWCASTWYYPQKLLSRTFKLQICRHIDFLDFFLDPRLHSITISLTGKAWWRAILIKTLFDRLFKGAFHLSEPFPFNQNSPARPAKSLTVCTKEMVFQQKLSKKDNFKLTGRAMVWPRPVLTNGKRPKIQCFWRKQIDLVVLLYRVKWSWFTAQAYSHRVCTLELFVVFNIKFKKYNFNIKNNKIFRREVTEEYTEKNLDMTKHKSEWYLNLKRVIFRNCYT